MCFDMRPIKLDLLDLSSGARPEVELDAPEFIVGRGKRVFVECVSNLRKRHDMMLLSGRMITKLLEG